MSLLERFRLEDKEVETMKTTPVKSVNLEETVVDEVQSEGQTDQASKTRN